MHKTIECQEKVFAHDFIYLTVLAHNDLDARIIVKFTPEPKKRVVSLDYVRTKTNCKFNLRDFKFETGSVKDKEAQLKELVVHMRGDRDHARVMCRELT